LEEFENTLRTVNDRLNRLTRIPDFAIDSREPLIETCRINNHILFLSRAVHSGLGDAIWRIQHDYYLTQTAVLREGDTIIDIGAHVGVVSIYLAKKFPLVTVYAIEPDPRNYACLLRNIALNGVANVVAINKAVSGDGHPRTLYADALETTWATLDASLASSRYALRTVQVESITLDQLFQEYAIGHCRLLKMTAMGAIQEILKGFTRRGCVDLLCGEVDLADCSRVQLEMASWRIARQYFWRTIDRDAHRTVHSWIQQIPTGIEQPHDRIEPTTRTTASLCTD
jgi:FkbM family methyltransferase